MLLGSLQCGPQGEGNSARGPPGKAQAAKGAGGSSWLLAASRAQYQVHVLWETKHLHGLPAPSLVFYLFLFAISDGYDRPCPHSSPSSPMPRSLTFINISFVFCLLVGFSQWVAPAGDLGIDDQGDIQIFILPAPSLMIRALALTMCL